MILRFYQHITVHVLYIYTWHEERKRNLIIIQLITLILTRRHAYSYRCFDPQILSFVMHIPTIYSWQIIC
jgi:hypothetical protein